MNLKSYIDLYQLLEKVSMSHAKNRTFGLEHREETPTRQLCTWAEKKAHILPKPLLSETLSAYLYGISLTLGVLALLLGVFSGIGLLSYSGHAPVNMVYFMVMVVGIPLVTMSLSLISLSRAQHSRSVLIHLSPAYWLEKIIALFPKHRQAQLSELRINPLLLNSLVIKRAQMLAFFFSLGLLLALLGTVATKDIAFAWSTTLQVTPEGFHHFLSILAWPWRELCPSAVPSVTLIEQSQYFRLGESLSSDMLSHAAKLGEWWKFLACATLFYAIVLRVGMWMLASFGFQRALRKSLMSLQGVEQLLYEMNSPLVTTHASATETPFVQGAHAYTRVMPCPSAKYAVILGWAMHPEDITLINDSLHMRGDNIWDVGGTKSLTEDSQIIKQCVGEVLFYVKAWEPPTMDWVDFLTELTEVSERVILLPIGMAAERYQPTSRDIETWMRKLQQIDNPKVWLCQNS